MSKLGENQSLLGWLLAGEVEMVLEEIGFNSYFTPCEVDKIRVLMQRVNNHEQLQQIKKQQETDGHI